MGTATISKVVLSEAQLADEMLKLDRARYVLDCKNKVSQAVGELWPGVFAAGVPHKDWSVLVDVVVLPELRGVRATQVTVKITRLHSVTGCHETRSFTQDMLPVAHIPMRSHTGEPSVRNALLCQVVSNINAY